MSKAEERRAAVAGAVADIRAIEAADGAGRTGLDRIRARLLALAAREDLFPEADFPKPAEDSALRSTMYRLSEDPDHRFALYLNAARSGIHAPVHDHTTWAVIVGMKGRELNRMYAGRAGDDTAPPRETGTAVVERGTGVAFLADELHSIHIEGAEGAVNFHMYGIGLEQLHGRRYYKPDEGRWITFPAHSGIVDARG